MTDSLPPTPYREVPVAAPVAGVCSGRHLSWAAVIAGLVTAIALEILFVMLGAGLGFAIFSPLTDPNPVKNFGAGAAVIEGISAVVSLWFGGWVAGRLTPVGVQRTGWLHGLVVWCSATVVAVAVAFTGAGWAFNGLSKVVGGGLSMAGRPAAAAATQATDAAKDALQHSKATVSSFVDEAASTPAPGATAASGIRTKREVGLALGRLFDPSQSANTASNRDAAVKVLVDDAGMSQADAEKAVSDWTASYQRLQAEIADAKNQAEAKAREEANDASKTLSVFLSCYFVAFVIGAAAAVSGGSHGTCIARRSEGRVVVR